MRFAKLILISSALMVQTAFAHGPKPGPLTNVPIPEVPGLLDGNDPIVVNKEKAIALGKALFWDMNVGSDGMACGSCHFHAGADSRVKNQLNPGLKNADPIAGKTYSVLSSGEGGPNHTLTQVDFPLHKRVNPFDQDSAVIIDTDDVVSSSGTFSGEFKAAPRFSGANDSCNRPADPVFHVDGTNTRHVEPRNAPTVINSIFNYRNFWDGRANNIYNGSSPWGERDPEAGVWVKTGRTVAKQRLHLENSALASLAMGPPLSDTEMSCQQRKWPDIGRKLLLRQPLQDQKVHYQDSVFAPLGLVNSTAGQEAAGLKATYKTLITQAFNSKYWAYGGSSTAFPAPPPGQTPYNQMEANFSMFFGLALQLYQGTLVSDQAPIDLVPRVLGNSNDGVYLDPDWAALYPDDTVKVESLTNGYNAFMSKHCATCHGGPLMTTAALASYKKMVTPTPGAYYGPDSARIDYGVNALGPNHGAGVAGITPNGNVVTRDVTVSEHPGHFEDIGFANTGVGRPDADPGLGGVDDFGNPLSFSYQYQQYLAGNTDKVIDQVVKNVKACNFVTPLVDPYYQDPQSQEVNPEFFNALDQLEDDGARDGVDKTQGCIVADASGVMNVPKIPSKAAAAAALNQPKMAVGSHAAFKIPTLRNVELTGPYMHNGSMATLEQVVEFYSRKGNFINDFQHNFMRSVSLAGSTLPPGSSRVSKQARADIVAFLKTFTDDRVRYERAPFDHPEVKVPHGHVGDAAAVSAGNAIEGKLAADEYLLVPAVGANGSSEPLRPFEAMLAP
ncbi:MAG: cytochrome c peroxidase [Methylomonas sp.]|nr:cytochrome c peroxidase [Methylomonas sp.]